MKWHLSRRRVGLLLTEMHESARKRTLACADARQFTQRRQAARNCGDERRAAASPDAAGVRMAKRPQVPAPTAVPWRRSCLMAAKAEVSHTARLGLASVPLPCFPREASVPASPR